MAMPLSCRLKKNIGRRRRTSLYGVGAVVLYFSFMNVLSRRSRMQLNRLFHSSRLIAGDPLCTAGI